jgi:hypothetical protein
MRAVSSEDTASWSRPCFPAIDSTCRFAEPTDLAVFFTSSLLPGTGRQRIAGRSIELPATATTLSPDASIRGTETSDLRRSVAGSSSSGWRVGSKICAQELWVFSTTIQSNTKILRQSGHGLLLEMGYAPRRDQDTQVYSRAPLNRTEKGLRTHADWEVWTACIFICVISLAILKGE